MQVELGFLAGATVSTLVMGVSLLNRMKQGVPEGVEGAHHPDRARAARDLSPVECGRGDGSATSADGDSRHRRG